MTDKEKNDAANDIMLMANLKGGAAAMAGGRRTRLGKRLAKESHELTMEALDIVLGPPTEAEKNLTDEELFKALSQ